MVEKRNEKRLNSLKFLVDKLKLDINDVKNIISKNSNDEKSIDDMLAILMCINQKLFGDDRTCINPIGLVLYYYFIEFPNLFQDGIEELKTLIKVYDTLLMWYEGYAWIELDLSLDAIRELLNKIRNLNDLNQKTAYAILAHYNDFNYNQTDEMFNSMLEQNNATPESVINAIEALETLTSDIVGDSSYE